MPEHPNILIRAARKRAGLSQREAAKKLNMSFSTYNRIEQGSTSSIKLALLPRIREVFDQPLDEIFAPAAAAQEFIESAKKALAADPEQAVGLSNEILDAISRQFS
ncbi:helix-turn-helix transcriptional regulator [Microbulbifer sp. 2205BS26-8]|uniref:helix-turn-helix transcriptional regulator n=1 Tax=Microbulbifer sp. 2205BS26-8 TaxID=3064386 RepID=UPI00273D456D|nr:helix-turn-helix transcriptional regulator [Microbulbifer sp. 2205BS26-8]MDP5210019.1 helix-turn-helix transcriptional regulator [Microbulbifer sp. 2205BS26-8]